MAASESSASPPIRRHWLREPLIHFVLIGALLFALDASVAARTENPNVITLSREADAEIRELFRASRQREPNAEELSALRQRWFDNELLYREGLALGLDRGDSGIRERVIFKALSVVSSDLTLPPPDDATLIAWFETQRQRYDEPPRVDFLEAVIVDDRSPETVRAFVDTLNDAGDTHVESGLRIYRGRPLPSITPAFGADFTEQLLALPLARWHAVDTDAGPRAIYIEQRQPGAEADFATVREAVLADWRDQRMAELRTDAVRALGDRYTLRVAGDAS